MYDLKLITCSPPTAKKLTYLYGSIEIQEKSVENKRKGKAHGLTKGKPSKLKGRKYEDFLAAYKLSNLSQKLLDKTFENFYYCRYEMLEVVHKSFLAQDLKNDFEVLLLDKYKRLGF
jgi:hypothetical protein